MNPEVAAQARHWIGLGRGERGLEVLDRADGEPDAEHLELRCRALMVESRWREGAEAAARGLALAPGDLDLQYLRALALEQLGDVAGSERLLLRCLAERPDDVDFLVAYSDLLLSNGQVDKAQRVLDRAAAAEPESIQVDLGRASLAFARNRTSESIGWARRALAKDPEHPGALRLLGSLEHVSGRSRRGAGRLGTVAVQHLDDRELAAYTREVRRESHVLLWPLQLERRIPGTLVLPVYLGLLAVGILLMSVDPLVWVGVTMVLLLLAFQLYTWIAVGILHLLTRRSGR